MGSNIWPSLGEELSILIWTGEPEMSMFPDQVFDWSVLVYGNVKEQIPTDAPTPIGKRVVLTTNVDANLYHDLVNGRALTAVLQLINQSLSQRQSQPIKSQPIKSSMSELAWVT